VTPDDLTVDGLAVKRFGPPDHSASVVVVHGTMDRGSSFRRMVRHLPDVEVVLYDRRGYAGSADAGLSLTLDEQLADLHAVMTVATHVPPVLFGHSLGGLLCLHAALRWPADCAALLVWEPPVPWLDWYRGSVGETASRMSEASDPEDVAEVFMRGMIGDRLWNRLPSAMKAERRSEGDALIADLALARSPSVVVDFGGVTVPTIAGCGADSPPRFGRSARLVLAEVPDAMMIEVADCDHGVHLSHPVELASLVSATVARAR
jgi:pimeloyl-ACP methyl ester carboxylesterase